MQCSACEEQLDKEWHQACCCGKFSVCSRAPCMDGPESLLHLLSCEHEHPRLSIEGGFEATGSAGAPDSSTNSKVTALRRLLTSKYSRQTESGRVKKVREAFERVFPIEEYPFKVMGFNRGTGRIIPLNKQRTVALGVMLPHQQLVRDSRAPYISDEGAIIIAPPGAGKTVMCHAVLANYSRQLVRIRTPMRYYLNPELKNLAVKSTESAEYEHRILIYVTKANLVGDVVKDSWAQSARSRELFERMMEEARASDKNRSREFSFRYSNSVNGQYTYAPFDKKVNVMSFKKFGNMLLGTNSVGRNFWAGMELGEPDNLKPIELDKSLKFEGRTPVPAAYWKDENDNYVRGNRPHNFMQALIDKDYNISIRLSQQAKVATGEMNQLRPALLELLRTSINDYPLFKRLGVKGVPPLTSLSVAFKNDELDVPAGTKGRPAKKFQFAARTSNLEWTANLLGKLDDKQWIEFAQSLQEPVIRLFRTVLKRPVNPETSAAFQVFPPTSENARGWRLERVGAKGYRWTPSDQGDYEFFNPVDRLVVVFDEGHLLFSPDNLLKAEESFDSNLIIQAFRESNGVAYFASATVDVITGIRMAQSLTPLPNVKGISEERRRELDIFPEYEGDTESFLDSIDPPGKDSSHRKARLAQLGAALAGKINVIDVSGMRDLFPDKRISSSLNIHYSINNEHARLIKAALGDSVSRLMNTVNVPFKLEERHKLQTSLFNPDLLLTELFGPSSPTGFPLARAVLEAMHRSDLDVQPEWLTGRGVICSALIDDTVTALAGVMQALGYEWQYLIPNRVDALIADPVSGREVTKREARKAMMKRGEDVPFDLRSVNFDPQGPLSTKHASDAVIRELGLEGMRAVPTYIGGVLTPPRFVVLSNELLVSRDDRRVLSGTDSFAEEALLSSDFAIPFRVRNVQALKSYGCSDQLLAEFRGTASPVLHYYPAIPAAQNVARAALGRAGGLSRLFEDGIKEPFFFIETRADDSKAYRKVRFPGQPDEPLLVDPATFTRESLEPVAREYTKMKDDFKVDAREIIRRTYNGGLAAMQRSNLRYILISRQYGQGIDAFLTQEVFRTEIPPDPATDEQGVGRFSRLNSLAELPYERQIVTYRTFIADYGKDVDKKNKIKGNSEPLNSILGPLKDNRDIRAVLLSELSDPLKALATERTKRGFNPKRTLLPYQAVRALTESPATTLRRAALLKDTLYSWAVDRNYNKPERETTPDPPNRVYSLTNYVLSSDAVTGFLKSRMEQLSPGSSLDDEVDWLLEGDPRAAAGRQTEALQRSGQLDVYRALLNDFTRPTILQISRRLAQREEDRTLSISIVGHIEQLDLSGLIGEAVRPLGQLGWLLRSGLARFDPGFASVDILSKKPKRVIGPKRPTADSGEAPAKRTRHTEPDVRIDPMDEDVVNGSLHYSTPTLIGARQSGDRYSVKVMEVHSIGIAVDRVAASDQEQSAIELDTLSRMEVLCKELEMAGDSDTSIETIYSRIKGGAGKGNPFLLKAGVLQLFQYGLLSQSRCLEIFTRGFSSHPPSYTRALEPASKTRFMIGLGTDLGRIYQLAFTENSADSQTGFAPALASIKQSVSVDLKNYEQRSALIRILHMICCDSRSSISLPELAQFFERCFGEFSMGKRGQQPKTVLLNLIKNLDKEPADSRFTLIDVFQMMISSVAASARSGLDSALTAMRAESSWTALAPELVPTARVIPLETVLAEKLSDSQFSGWRGLGRDEGFEAIWLASLENWPIKRWVHRVTGALKIPLEEAKQRFRAVCVSSNSFNRFVHSFQRLLEEADPSSSVALDPEPDELPPTPYLESLPMLSYWSETDKEPAAVIRSGHGFAWLKHGRQGQIDDPVQQLINGMRGRYPQIRLTSEATVRLLLDEASLAVLPARLTHLFRKFNREFRDSLMDPPAALSLIKLGQEDVRYTRKVFKNTELTLPSFIRLAESDLSGLDYLVRFLRRVSAEAAIPQLDVLVDYSVQLASSELWFQESIELLCTLPATKDQFSVLNDRISSVTRLYAVDATLCRYLLVDVWRKDPDLSLMDMLRRIVPKIVDELNALLEESFSQMSGERGTLPEPEEDLSPVEPLPESAGEESAVQPEDPMDETEPGSDSESSVEKVPVVITIPDPPSEPAPVPPPPKDVYVIDDDDDYPAPSIPEVITLDERLRQIVSL